MPRHRKSELDRMIDRLVTQRACIEQAARLVGDRPGAVVEIGLGKGRTFDHLRRSFAGRKIYAFDREVHAPAGLVPEDEFLLLGDLYVTLPEGLACITEPLALVHADIGTRDRAADAELVAFIAGQLDSKLQSGGLVLSDRPMQAPGLTALALPENAGGWPYFMLEAR